MKNNNFQEWLDELKFKTDIVSVVSRYVPLEKKGRNMWGLCPFHHEKTASFSVNADGQFYHCFGCGVSGDVISFVKELEGLDFIDTLELLAGRVGMQLPKMQSDNKTFEQKQKKDKLLAVMREAANYYHLNLNLEKATLAKDYIAKRGIDASELKKFGIGYSVGYNEVISYLRDKGYHESLMYEAGLLDQKDGRYYDALFNRLLFPICNMFGQVVAFGGRLLEQKDFAKYKNTRETLIFVKNKTLYGLHLVKKLKLTEKVEDIIIVEGYMDTIALSAAGIYNVVASMGTALTKEQARILKRQTEKVIICYDGDAAGQIATLRGLDILYGEGLDVKVVSLPEGLDPDDVIKTHGKEYFVSLLDKALPLTEYKLKLIEAKYDFETTEGRGKFASEAITVLKSLNNNIEMEAYLESISNISRIKYETLRAELYKKAEKEPDFPKAAEKDASAYQIAERYILNAMLYGKSFVDYSEDFECLLISPFSIEIYEYIKSCVEKGRKPIPSSLLSLFEEKDRDKVMEIIDYPAPSEKVEEEYYNGCVKTLYNNYIDNECRKTAKEYESSDDEENKKVLLNKLLELKQKIRR